LLSERQTVAMEPAIAGRPPAHLRDSPGHAKHSCQRPAGRSTRRKGRRTRRTALPDTHVGSRWISPAKPACLRNPKRKVSAVRPKAAGSFVISRRRVSETMSACITNSYGDCYRDFDRRSCWHSHEKVDARERNEEKPHSTQTHQEFVGIKSRPAVMNFRKNRKARSFADGQTEALAIFASPNLPSIVPMGAFPLTIVALGHVSRRNFDNMAS
jgi:hypothetical protein